MKHDAMTGTDEYIDQRDEPKNDYEDFIVALSQQSSPSSSGEIISVVSDYRGLATPLK
jgi:hypothetical protein